LQLDFWQVQYATLNNLPLSKAFPTHQRQIEEQLTMTRHQRQKAFVLDCELSVWYKLLVRSVSTLHGHLKDAGIRRLWVICCDPKFNTESDKQEILILISSSVQCVPIAHMFVV
jgi:hypothetical protein